MELASCRNETLCGVPRVVLRRADPHDFNRTRPGRHDLEGSLTGFHPSAGSRLADTHCHLFFPELADRLDEVLADARKAGVGLMVCPGIDPETSLSAVDIAKKHGLLAAVGIHPAEAVALKDRFPEIERLAFEPGVCAIGESGLDLHRETPGLDDQIDLLLEHASLAKDIDLPLVLHSRHAEEKLLQVLPVVSPVPVILHCYTGPAGQALEAVRRGYFVSFAGALTFRKNGELRETLRRLPREQVLVETDSPFMAPEPFRGRPCEPSFVEHTARVVAGAWGTTEEEAFGILLENSLRAFRQGEYLRPSVIYILGVRAYVNLTGRCCNSCRFCIRGIRAGLGGYHLTHSGADPSEERVLGSLARLSRDGLKELVFCGYGEPTARPGLLGRAATLARSRGWRLRLNTNGLALAFSTREEAGGLLRLFDTVSISLNAFDPASYEALCRPGVPDAWENLLDFIRLAEETGIEIRLTAVANEGLDMAAVREVAAGLGHRLTVRGR